MFKRIFYLVLLASTVLLMSSHEFSFENFLNQKLATANVFFLPTLSSTTTAIAETPLPEPEVYELPALRTLENESLQTQLLARLNENPHWRKLIAQQRMAIGIVDMSDEDAVAYAGVNHRHMMYAASLPKIAVLAAAHDAIERGELAETPVIENDLRLMIARSNNAATTRMIDRVGFENIERTMTAPQLKLYDPAFGGGLWVGKRYAAGGRRYPDPIKGLSHAATTEQVCRYFYLLANDQLISPESSAKMRSYLVNPELHHKFVNTLDRIAPQAKVYRKSGSWKSFHADVVLVQGPSRNYIMTALIDDPSGEQICRELAVVLDELLKE